MLEGLQQYAQRQGVLRGTLEETTVGILDSLAQEPGNFRENGFRMELLSASSVVLNGLGKMKDPLVLLSRLGKAFERRGICIFTHTVVNAFNRLFLEAVRQQRVEEAAEIWQEFAPYCKASACRYLPHPAFLSLINEGVYHGEIEGNVLSLVAHNLSARTDMSHEELRSLLKHRSSMIREAAAEAMCHKGGLPDDGVLTLFRDEDEKIRRGAMAGFARRKDFPALFKLLRRRIEPDSHDIDDQEAALIRMLTHKSQEVRWGAGKILCCLAAVPKQVLTNILEGSDNAATMAVLDILAQRADFTKEDLWRIFQSEKFAFDERIAPALASRMDATTEEILDLLSSPSQFVRTRAAAAVIQRKDLNVDDLAVLSSQSTSVDVCQILKKAIEAKKKTPLKNISGSRKHRTKTMREKMRMFVAKE